MYPVLFSIGSLSVSSFGVFLALAFITAAFTSWKLARIYDLDEGKILDLVILTFFGGILGSRVYFVLTHWGLFGDLGKAVLINRYPGLSFWGGFLGGSLAFWFLTRKLKLNFWQLADLAAVGLVLGISLGDLGCLLGGCAYGQTSNLPISAPVVGLIGRRLPISLIESFILLFALAYIWEQEVKFHFAGKVAAVSLIILGVVKFVTEYYRGDSFPVLPNLPLFSFGHLFSLILIVLGIVIYYRRSKRQFVSDLRFVLTLPVSDKSRKVVLFTLKKSWYNQIVSWRIWAGKAVGSLQVVMGVIKRRLNVKSTPKNFR